jgi:hypothetical protein
VDWDVALIVDESIARMLYGRQITPASTDFNQRLQYPGNGNGPNGAGFTLAKVSNFKYNPSP